MPLPLPQAGQAVCMLHGFLVHLLAQRAGLDLLLPAARIITQASSAEAKAAAMIHPIRRAASLLQPGSWLVSPQLRIALNIASMGAVASASLRGLGLSAQLFRCAASFFLSWFSQHTDDSDYVQTAVGDGRLRRLVSTPAAAAATAVALNFRGTCPPNVIATLLCRPSHVS